MDEQKCLSNLQQIISIESEKTGQGEIFSDELQNFLREIADDKFLMPPFYSGGHTFKHLLWNYLSLKTEIKSRFDEKVLSKWQLFQKMANEQPAETTTGPQGIEKIAETTEKEQALKQSIPEHAQSGPAEMKADEEQKAEETNALNSLKVLGEKPEGSVPSPAEKAPKAEKTKPETFQKAPKEKGETKKPESRKVVTKKSPIKKTTIKKPALKKTASKKAAVKKPSVKKKSSVAPVANTSRDDDKWQTEAKSLTKDLNDLTREFKALEKKIEKMLQTADDIAGQKAGKTKTVKKTVTQKTTPKKGTKLTDADRVVRIIMKLKKGSDVSSLSQKTGFSTPKIRSIISRALKKGEIKRTGRGIYSGS